MRAPLVRSLRGQTLLVMLVGLLVSHGIAIALYSDDRGDALTLIEAEDMAERIAGMVMLIAQLPREQHEGVARASSTSAFRVTVGELPAEAGPAEAGDGLAAQLDPYLRDLIAGLAPGWSVVAVRSAPATGAPTSPEGTSAVPSTRFHHLLSASIRSDDGQTLSFVTSIPGRRLPWPAPVGHYILVLTALVLAVSVWSVGRVTRPLQVLARAAEGLGRDIAETPLAEQGPVEVVTAVRALNAMQERLRRLIDNRTRMLAAISHDLRTPVTRLRLRAEFLGKAEEREKFLETLDEMDAMIAAFLAFAREGGDLEPLRTVDMAALVESLCGDLAEAGLPVEVEVPDKSLLRCRRWEIGRAVANLIDNAVKYGGGARVSLTDRADAVEVFVDDDGPGIPADRLDGMCMPFVRGDESRSPLRSGFGLGLSIAKAIVEAHGGELSLANRPQGGLRARMVVPK